MLFPCLLDALFAVANGQGNLYEASCPPENSHVEAFRTLTDVREPLHLPHQEKIMQDAGWAKAEFKALIADVDLLWKIAVNLNDSSYLAIPFLERCCPADEESFHECTYKDIILQYVNFQGGVCWVVWPEPYYIYKRCTCCSCLVQEESCPVVGRCVETGYVTVVVISYCPHIMYSDRWQRIAMQLPSACRCQAACPTPQNFVEPFNSPSEEKYLQNSKVDVYNNVAGVNLQEKYGG